MRVIVLSSGSKGNTTYVEAGGTGILIDAGNSCKYICDALERNNINPNSIDGILLTHTHTDHTYGLRVFAKRYKTPVYLRRKMLTKIDFLDNYLIVEEEHFMVGKIMIHVVNTSHDAPDSMGFVVEYNDNTLVYITDTGYINEKYHDLLRNKNIYVFESNHDVEMLQHGSYDRRTKVRILSDKGHLSNEDSSKYLCKFIGNETKCIMLAHLSENNNTEELAYLALREKLDKYDIHFTNIKVLKQSEVNEEVSI